MRCLLDSAGLGPEYWSWAFLHSIYLKNRLPHKATGCTPHCTWSSTKPNAKLLKNFGCPVVVKLPGSRAAKLDNYTVTGIFLGYTASEHNIYFRDNRTKCINIAAHVQFDEAGMTIPKADRSHFMNALQELGYTSKESTAPIEQDEDKTIDEDTLRVQLLLDKATLPKRATKESAGYDIYSATNRVIQPGTYELIPIDITFQPPDGTYGQLFSRSGLSVKHGIDVRAGTIDADYRGNVMVKLENNSNQPYQVRQGDRIAQLVLYAIAQSTVTTVEQLPNTARGDKGFGSSGLNDIVVRNAQTAAPQNILEEPAANKPKDIMEITTNIIHEDGIKPYSLWMSTDAYDIKLTINIDVRGDHPTLGMVLEKCSNRSRLRLMSMEKSTPGARVAKWRSTLRSSFLLNINGEEIKSLEARRVINEARKQKLFKLKCTFGVDKHYGVHPIDGNLHLYYDQMHALAKHGHAADIKHRKMLRTEKSSSPGPTKQDTSDTTQTDAPDDDSTSTPMPCIRQTKTMDKDTLVQQNEELGHSFSKKEVMKRSDCQEWRASCTNVQRP